MFSTFLKISFTELGFSDKYNSYRSSQKEAVRTEWQFILPTFKPAASGVK